MQFTHNNHLKYWISDRLFGERACPFEKYLVSVGSADPDLVKNVSFYDEQLRIAKLVRASLGDELAVMFSGGTDSEIVVKSFLSIGFKPRIVFVRFVGGYNDSDYTIAQKIAFDCCLHLETVDFDVIDFYRSGAAAQLAAEVQCKQIAYLSIYENIRRLGVPAVMGGEIMFRRHVTPAGSRWFYCFRENEDGSAVRFSNKFNLPVVNEWFSYTPETIAIYLNDPGIQWLINTPDNYKLASVSSKNRILQRLFPGLLPKRKTHGYEKLLGFNGETYRTLSLTHPKRLASGIEGIFVEDLMEQLNASR